ncbi:hypothetical protein [Novosphingopyxis sp.]|uniref:hypothetical protein n=1 Tax=Novosphingopyxis sp. TaxID=2709690 RepID=UPI003B5AC841
MTIAESLRIKYGLDRLPTNPEIAEWRRVTENLIREGEPAEKAGDLAAQYNLPGYKTHVFKTEADSIEALLRALAQK